MDALLGVVVFRFFFLFVLFCLHSLFVGIFTKEIVIDEI